VKIYTKLIASESFHRQLPLTYEQRLKSRFRLSLSATEEISVILPRSSRIRTGMCLATDDGDLLKVVSAVEELSIVMATGLDLARACYHLGNRHTAAAIHSDSVSYLKDQVIDDMMRGLGFDVDYHRYFFEPEPGAYHTDSQVLPHSAY